MVPSGDSRRGKQPLVLILLVLASLALVVVELRSPNRIATAGRWTVAVFSPFFQGGRWASDRLRGGALQLIHVQTMRMENEQLKAENVKLALTNSVQRERIAKLERERTSELPKLPDTVLSPLYANVIGISIQRWDHTLTVDRGELDGVRKAMPVVDYSGSVVGIVSETSRRESIIKLITDPGFSMGAMIEDNASRDQGLLAGLGESDIVQFRPNEPQKPLQVDMEVISTGFKGSLYPKGLRIGRIVRFNKDKFGTDFAYVQPHANFESIEEVIIVDSESIHYKPGAASAPTTMPAAAEYALNQLVAAPEEAIAQPEPAIETALEAEVSAE